MIKAVRASNLFGLCFAALKWKPRDVTKARNVKEDLQFN